MELILITKDTKFSDIKKGNYIICIGKNYDNGFYGKLD
jgi:hypothetical protein